MVLNINVEFYLIENDTNFWPCCKQQQQIARNVFHIQIKHWNINNFILIKHNQMKTLNVEETVQQTNLQTNVLKKMKHKLGVIN